MGFVRTTAETKIREALELTYFLMESFCIILSFINLSPYIIPNTTGDAVTEDGY